MVSVQERLKLKRAQIDTWSVREQLCLASSVLRSGDQNWMSVSRSLKAFGDSGRPADWFSQKSCAVQYSSLLENVETPKRKKRTDKGDTSVDTPGESIVRRLTQERIDELKRLLNEDGQLYAKLKEEVMQIKAGCADDKLNDMCQEIEEEKRQKERKAEAHERWLKEREEKKVELERAWKPPVTPASPHRRKNQPKIHRRNSSQSEPSSEAESALDSPLSEPLNVDVIGEENVQETSVDPKPSQTPTSPLLTSLLKSPSPAPTSQGSSILHSAITSHRGASPTITSLLSSAPGVPGTGNSVTVAPPTTVSSSLKNLVSSAISSEQPHHQPPPHNPSPAAGAPTLSMLLELPPSLPGKPLPELPSAAKTTTLPPSTVSAIVSAAITPSTASPKVIAVRAGTNAVVPATSSKIITSVPVSSTSNNEVQSTSQEIKIADSTSKDEDIEVLQVDSSQNSVDAQQLPIETKEELIEEVLIEEVVVNDDSVIDSELLSSQIADEVASEQEDTREKQVKDREQVNLDEEVIEVSQSSDVLPQKEETKAEMVADVDSTSNNMALSVSVEDTNVTEEKTCKEENIEAVIDTSSPELVSEIVTEETAAVEMVPTTEAELTSGAVAEVIEITEEQESTIQTEVVGECGPCIQELEDMEVIILDKVQGLDEVQIVEDMKELECEVVEVVMGGQEKVEDEVKEDNGELVDDSIKTEEATTVDTSSLVDDTVLECKNTDGADSSSKSDGLTIEHEVENEDNSTCDKIAEDTEGGDEEIIEEEEVLNDDVSSVSEKPATSPDVITIENTEEHDDDDDDDDADKQPEIIVERISLEENSNEAKDEDEQEVEILTEDVHSDVIVDTSESPTEMESAEDFCDKELDTKAVDKCREIQEDHVSESEKEDIVKEEYANDSEPVSGIVVQDSTVSDSALKETEIEIPEKESQDTKKEELTRENVKKETVTKEILRKDPTTKDALKMDVSKEPVTTKKDVLRESSKKDDNSKEIALKKEQKSTRESTREIIKKELVIKEDEKKELEVKEQNESQTHKKFDVQPEKPVEDSVTKAEVKLPTKEVSKKELQKVSESSKKPVKESLKKIVGEKSSAKEKEANKKDNLKKDKEVPTKEIEKDSNIKDSKKDILSKDLNKKEVQIVLPKDTIKKEVQIEADMKKPIPPKEVSKRELPLPKKDIPFTRKDLSVTKKDLPVTKKDLPVTKKDLPVTKKDIPISKKDIPVKEVAKENQSKRELLRRDSKEDITRKEVLKRGLTKEDKKESAKDDMKKRPHIKEIPKNLRKADADKADTKSSDIAKPEPISKVEKNKRDNESVKEEGKEIKKEKPNKENQTKTEEEKSKDQPELKIASIHSKGKSVAEESNKIINIVEKKDGKELSKGNVTQEIVPKSEPMESTEEKQEKSEKPEKRMPLRSETPSTEDDKTNDAEPPKVVGRKRLTAMNALDSVPNSPASTTDEEREYKSWKKSIMLLYGRLATHKYASLFLRPITDDQAPGYSSVVHRPIDLLTIKKNIETGVIRTTAEFQRDVMLMFLNSIMYNKSSHLVHKMAKQMQQEGMQHIQDFLTTQMLVQVVGDGVPIRRETRTTEANKQRDILGNPSGAASQDENDNAQMHKRKRNVGNEISERGFKKKKVDE